MICVEISEGYWFFFNEERKVRDVVFREKKKVFFCIVEYFTILFYVHNQNIT
jgi:hypothetical protein